MQYTMIDRKQAPAEGPLRGGKKRVEGLEELVASLEPGRVARVELGEDEKFRLVSEQLYRTASRAGKLVHLWNVAGILYVELVDADQKG